jgi:hypothetical protein
MRAPDRLVRQAVAFGPNIGQFSSPSACWMHPFPWSKLRQGQRLLRLVERYTPERLDAECARALGFDLVDVRRLERILILALEHEGQPAPPMEQRVQPLPTGRFHPTGQCLRSSLRFIASGDSAMTVDPDLVRLIKRLKLGPLVPTLPERLRWRAPNSSTTLRFSPCYWRTRSSGATIRPSNAT